VARTINRRPAVEIIPAAIAPVGGKRESLRNRSEILDVFRSTLNPRSGAAANRSDGDKPYPGKNSERFTERFSEAGTRIAPKSPNRSVNRSGAILRVRPQELFRELRGITGSLILRHRVRRAASQELSGRFLAVNSLANSGWRSGCALPRRTDRPWLPLPCSWLHRALLVLSAACCRPPTEIASEGCGRHAGHRRGHRASPRRARNSRPEQPAEWPHPGSPPWSATGRKVQRRR
jgi:hypothetical protein